MVTLIVHKGCKINFAETGVIISEFGETNEQIVFQKPTRKEKIIDSKVDKENISNSNVSICNKSETSNSDNSDLHRKNSKPRKRLLVNNPENWQNFSVESNNVNSDVITPRLSFANQVPTSQQTFNSENSQASRDKSKTRRRLFVNNKEFTRSFSESIDNVITNVSDNNLTPPNHLYFSHYSLSIQHQIAKKSIRNN